MARVTALLLSGFVGSTSAADDTEWGYSGAIGPEHWGDLSPEFAACSKGTEQSPIDLTQPTEVELPPLEISYRASDLRIENTGHTIRFNIPEGSYLESEGKRFRLLEGHFHAPGEHTVDGEGFPVELHLVHQAEDGQLAVIGVLIRKGARHAAYDPIFDHLPAEAGPARSYPSVQVDPAALLPRDHGYYRYDGSLTTPDCREGVAWYVLTTPVTLSGLQIKAFTRIYDGNARPVQPLNDRELKVSTD